MNQPLTARIPHLELDVELSDEALDCVVGGLSRAFTAPEELSPPDTAGARSILPLHPGAVVAAGVPS